MMKSIYRAGARFFLKLVKPTLTKAYNWYYKWPESPVIQFYAPEGAVHYYKVKKENPYTGDPLWGAFDCYTSPRALQWALENGSPAQFGNHIDCDDVALWYQAALKASPLIRELDLYSLIDRGVVGSHVVACGQTTDGRSFTLDTNGLAYLPDLQESTICAHFNKVYATLGYNYILVEHTDQPFPENG